MPDLVKHAVCSSLTAYNNIVTKDPNTIYFVATDNGPGSVLYKGTDCIGSFKLITSAVGSGTAATCVEGVLYFCINDGCFYYKSSDSMYKAFSLIKAANVSSNQNNDDAVPSVAAVYQAINDRMSGYGRYLPPVQSIADLKAITEMLDKDLVYVENEYSMYGFDAQSTATPDDSNVVAPNGTLTGSNATGQLSIMNGTYEHVAEYDTTHTDVTYPAYHRTDGNGNHVYLQYVYSNFNSQWMWVGVNTPIPATGSSGETWDDWTPNPSEAAMIYANSSQTDITQCTFSEGTYYSGTVPSFTLSSPTGRWIRLSGSMQYNSRDFNVGASGLELNTPIPAVSTGSAGQVLAINQAGTGLYYKDITIPSVPDSIIVTDTLTGLTNGNIYFYTGATSGGIDSNTIITVINNSPVQLSYDKSVLDTIITWQSYSNPS